MFLDFYNCIIVLFNRIYYINVYNSNVIHQIPIFTSFRDDILLHHTFANLYIFLPVMVSIFNLLELTMTVILIK